MASGLFALLDDVATIAKTTAASLDDIAAGAAKAGAKSSAVVIDDAAVTPSYVSSIPAHRELGIVRHIAFGSIRNKLLIILPGALILSQFAEWALPILLIFGGLFLAFEGAEKVLSWLGFHHGHDAHPVTTEPEHSKKEQTANSLEESDDNDAPTEREKVLIGGAVRTDLILSTEIMLISLANLEMDDFFSRFIALVLIALFMTVAVYGSVAVIIRLDDWGLAITQTKQKWAHTLGHGLVKFMPILLKTLTIVGTIAMLWVGGHLLLANAHELGLTAPYDLVHDIEHALHASGLLLWLVDTTCSAIAGLVIGVMVVFLILGIAKLVSLVKKPSAPNEKSAPAV